MNSIFKKLCRRPDNYGDKNYLQLVESLKDIEMWQVDYVNNCYVFKLPRGSSVIDVESAFKEAMDIHEIPSNVIITKENISGRPIPDITEKSLGNIIINY